jgi:hypothetical protein
VRPQATPVSAPAASLVAAAPITPSISSLPPLGDEIVVVSGLPRSGTSMVMQMLAAGGLPVLADDHRSIDADNPRGYFEYEPVKHLHEKAEWLMEARGKAVKIVAPLLRYLPPSVACRIILIERDLNEVTASQEAMLARRGEVGQKAATRRARLRQEYARQVQQIKTRFSQRARCHCLVLEHGAVLRSPVTAAEELNRFLGGQLAVEAMAAQVDPNLHRQRMST